MKKFVSIRTKLIFNTMLLISVAFAVLLSVITISNIITVNKNIEKSKASIYNALIAKGKTLTINNSMAMGGMAEDNAFTAIQGLVSATVTNDEDVVYGIYMENMRIPWVYANSENPTGVPKESKPLEDSLSLWASSLSELAFRELTNAKGTIDIIEFAAPVVNTDGILGFIRYGFSTKAMDRSIKETQIAGQISRNIALLIILVMGIVSVTIGFFVIRKVAAHITRPIAALVNSAKFISDGNYDVPINPESNDEIGDLAGHFDAMRFTVKKYTDHLQDLIDEKMQQVNDILNNIDQGLFTVNFDGSVNQEYSSRANKILKVNDVASCTIKELLRFDAKQERSFSTWLELVQKKHAQQRWTKLAKLAPVQEIELLAHPDTTDMEYISISYQRIYDKQGNLSKIMVLALDETEKRLKDMQMAAERLKHENDVKAILSIANTPAEEISEFTEDTSSRMRELHAEIRMHLEGVNVQRENYPGSTPYLITKEHIDRIYRDLHTIKGNGGSYGFEMLSHFAHLAEDELEKLREPVLERRNINLTTISGYLDKMDQSLDDIHQKIRLIFGKDEEITIRIPETRINHIVDMSTALLPHSDNNQVKALITECIMLSWKPLKTLFRKYQKLALKVARKLHKNITFTIIDDNKLLPHDSINDLDEVLLHLIRNSVDHGLEPPEVREELGKGVGRITTSLTCTDAARVMIFSDDGKGIDTELLVEKSITKGFLSRDEADNLTEQQRIELLFRGGLSTSETISEISGRGMGMQIIHHKITEQLKGTIKIESLLGKGVTFTITIPLKKEV